MGNWVTISTGGAGGYTPPAGPTAFVIDSADGSYDVDAGELTIALAVHPSGGLGTTVGGHVYLEVPDQSAQGTTTFRLAASALASADRLRGTWRPLDAGQYPYVAEEQPWTVTLLIKTNTLHAGGSVTNVRAYVSAYSDDVELPLVRAGLTGETPSIVCAVDPNVKKPGSGSSDAPNVASITAVCLSEDDSTGTLRTPIAVTVTGLPDPVPSGWGYEVCLTWDETFPDYTDPNVGQVASGIFDTEGLIPAGPDGITAPHTLALDTPTRIVTGVVWVRALLKDSAGNIRRNAIKPGVTQSANISVGVVDGTLGCRSLQDKTVLGDALKDRTVTSINIAIATITGTNIAVATITGTNIQTATITGTNIGPATITGTNIGAATILGTNIGTATIAGTNIGAATILGANIGAATILGGNIGAATIAGSNIQSATITGTNIGAATIAGNNIQSATILGSNIGAATIAGNNIGSATIEGTNIKSATIAGSNIGSATVAGSNIQSATITGTQIAAAT